jgi:glycosyltransferase involved in cell wall biosynthesis
VEKSKKILIFSTAYYPKFVGGAEVAVKEITDRLNPDGYEFHLITLRLDKDLPKEEKIGNVFVHRVGFAGQMKESADSLRFPLHYNKYLFPFISAWRGLQLSKKHDFYINWSIMANYAGFGALFFKLLKPKIPFLLTLQEGDPIDYIKKRVFFVYPIFKMIFKKANSIQAISNYLADFGKSMGFKGKPVVVPNGVDIALFTKNISQEEKQDIRKDLNLEENDVALITTSRLAIKNGVGDVIKALTKLPANIKFVVLGEGYLEQELKNLAESLNVSKKVIFKGYVSHNEMPKFLKACDIFIRPSLSEGMGNSFLEAMAARLPVIATPVGGIVDFLFENKTGYFCKPENPESVAEAVQKIISDSDKNQIIENAYKMVVEIYDWNKIALEMKGVFK